VGDDAGEELAAMARSWFTLHLVLRAAAASFAVPARRPLRRAGCP
jgi:hypothetical protein